MHLYENISFLESGKNTQKSNEKTQTQTNKCQRLREDLTRSTKGLKINNKYNNQTQIAKHLNTV